MTVRVTVNGQAEVMDARASLQASRLVVELLQPDRDEPGWVITEARVGSLAYALAPAGDAPTANAWAWTVVQGARVLGLRRRDANQSSAYCATVGETRTAPGSGALHVPTSTSWAWPPSHASASIFVSNVTGAGRVCPSGPGKRACHRPEGKVRNLHGPPRSTRIQALCAVSPLGFCQGTGCTIGGIDGPR